MTTDQAINKLTQNAKTIHDPKLKLAAQKTLEDYDQQINMSFRDKVDPDGNPWEPWSDIYRKYVEEESGFAETLDNGVDRYNSGLVIDERQEYKYNKDFRGHHLGEKVRKIREKATLADYVGNTGESESHTMLVLTGTLYQSALDAVHNATPKDDGFTLDLASALPEYAMIHEHGGQGTWGHVPPRPYMRMGPIVLDAAVEHGLDELLNQIMSAW